MGGWGPPVRLRLSPFPTGTRRNARYQHGSGATIHRNENEEQQENEKQEEKYVTRKKHDPSTSKRTTQPAEYLQDATLAGFFWK
jgi:hypothetical protein